MDGCEPGELSGWVGGRDACMHVKRWLPAAPGRELVGLVSRQLAQAPHGANLKKIKDGSCTSRLTLNRPHLLTDARLQWLPLPHPPSPLRPGIANRPTANRSCLHAQASSVNRSRHTNTISRSSISAEARLKWLTPGRREDKRGLRRKNGPLPNVGDSGY